MRRFMQRGGADGSARWVQRGTGRTVDRCVEAVCAPGSPGALNRVCLAVTLSRGLSYLVSVSVYVLPAWKGFLRSMRSCPCVPISRAQAASNAQGKRVSRGLSGEACGWHLEAADGWFV
jgi:hypothetical protein